MSTSPCTLFTPPCWLNSSNCPEFGCVSELVTYLRAKLARSECADASIEVHILVANYGVTKWSEGCINADKIHGISIPVVWRYVRLPEEGNRVRAQFKSSLHDLGTFEKSEWGPLIKKKVSRNNPSTGQVEEVRVQRSDQKGLERKHHYPDVEDDSGLEEWLPAEKWSMDKVLTDIIRWVYDDFSLTTARKDEWNALRAWHRAYATSDAVHAGQRYTVGPDLVIDISPALSWSEMWKLLDSRAPWNQEEGTSASAAGETAGNI
eukprot:6208080-Pleurochrysis_carterae.AAC.1